MTLRTLAASVVLALSTLAVCLLTPAVARTERGLEVGQTLPPREVNLLSRERASVPTPEGLTVLLFWSTWSPRSEQALALWRQYQDDYASHKVRVVTVNADHQNMTEEDLRLVDQYLRDKGVTLPVYQDGNLELYNEIGVMVLPTVYFLKGDGTIAYKYPGFPSSAALDLKDDLEKALGIYVPPPPKATATAAYQPKNNAALYFNLGKQLHMKGSLTTAEGRYLEALKRDPDYDEPLRALEGIHFASGRTPAAEEALAKVLSDAGLAQLKERIGQGEPLIFSVEKKSDPKLRLQELLKREGAAPAQ